VVSIVKKCKKAVADLGRILLVHKHQNSVIITKAPGKMDAENYIYHKEAITMDFYKRALELKDETVADRRYIHQNAETGLELPKTKAYVMDKLKEYGLDPVECGEGVTATLGNGGRVLLLRADMDGLPMPEKSGEAFACPTGKTAHTCGHDFHAAMLLSAARILKEQESKLVGLFMYNDKGTMMYSVDGFKITVKGKGSHGAYPHAGVDPINIGVHIHLALQELIARETDPAHACVLTIGQFKAGEAANIIPETAVLQGTIRTNNTKERELLVRRMKEVAEKTAAVYNGSVEIEMISEVPPLICNPALTDEMIGYMKEMDIPGLTPVPDVSASASEDFAVIAEKVPSTFMYLSAGYTDERGTYPAHNPKVQFNEDVCPIGVACLAQCAVKWLESHQE